MRQDLAATYDLARQQAIVDRIIQVWRTRFSVIGPPAPPPTTDQATLDFLAVQKQCIEWSDTIAINGGGRGLTYDAPAVSSAAARPGMGLFRNDRSHATVIVDINWRSGAAIQFKLAEANQTPDEWMNPHGQIPWLRSVRVGRITDGAGYKIVDFER